MAKGFSDYISGPAASTKDLASGADANISAKDAGRNSVEAYSLVDPDPNVSFAVLFQKANDAKEVLELAKSGAADAAEKLLEKFSVENKEQKVVLSDAFLEKVAADHGVPPAEFHVKDLKIGVLTLDSAAPAAQFERLQADVDKIQKEYGTLFTENLQVYRTKDQATGKDIAIVTGLDNHDRKEVDLLNSLRKAESEYQQVQKTLKAALNPEKNEKKEPEKLVEEGKMKELEAKYPNKPGEEQGAQDKAHGAVSPQPVYAAGMQKSDDKDKGRAA